MKHKSSSPSDTAANLDRTAGVHHGALPVPDIRESCQQASQEAGQCGCSRVRTGRPTFRKPNGETRRRQLIEERPWKKWRNGGLRAQWGGHSPCTLPMHIQSLAPYAVPRAARCDPSITRGDPKTKKQKKPGLLDIAAASPRW